MKTWTDAAARTWPALALTLLTVLPLAAAEKKPLPKDLPPFGQDKPLPVPTIAQSTTPEGLTVWLVKRTGFPKLAAVLAARGGTAADPKGLEGVAELLADTIKEGTARRTSRQIAEQLQSVGGELSASATDDAMILSANGLGTGAGRLIEILADVALNAAFPAQEVELAKTNALQNLEVRASTPEFLAEKAFAKAVYGDHPYHVVSATAETIEAVTPEVLEREHGRRFRPERALLVVVGEFDATAVARQVTRAFAGWKGRGDAPSPTPPSPAAGSRRILLVDRPGSVQSSIIAGRTSFGATDPDYFPTLVANTVFGGSFASRLTENIREDKGYTYSASSSAQTYEKGGLLEVRADVRNEVTAPTLLETFYELDRMGATSPTDEELSRAKRFQAGLFVLRNQLQGAVARTLATNWVNGLPPSALGEFVPKVGAVTAEQVRKVGRAIFSSNTQTIVVVGDALKVKDELALFGDVTESKP